jgi:hypothetical protein
MKHYLIAVIIYKCGGCKYRKIPAQEEVCRPYKKGADLLECGNLRYSKVHIFSIPKTIFGKCFNASVNCQLIEKLEELWDYSNSTLTIMATFSSSRQ